jgi:hypothetical protein
VAAFRHVAHEFEVLAHGCRKKAKTEARFYLITWQTLPARFGLSR